MAPSITRRDLLKAAGGAALGMLFTPVPWKLLDDSAIWTQNWDLIPKLPRGSFTHKVSACTLCPAGCALSARCAGGNPVSLQGIAEYGSARGMLCPVGLAGHHVAGNPLRLEAPVAFSGPEHNATLAPISSEDAARRIARAIDSRSPGGRVAILDGRPGRALSGAYRRFLSTIDESDYLRPHTGDDLTTSCLGAMLGRSPLEIGLDIAHADLVLSVGAPLFDGWGTPERMAALLDGQRCGRCSVIQVEAVRSRTAEQARHWLAIRPNAELALGLGLLHLLLQEGRGGFPGLSALHDARELGELTADATPEQTEERTGLPSAQIRRTAQMLAHARQPLVLAGCDPAGGPLPHAAAHIFSAMNLLLQRPDRASSVHLRGRLPDEPEEASRTLVNLPDRSLAVLILDGADNGHRFPWEQVERKLIPGRSLVVSLSPYFTPLSAHADLIVPGPAHLEAMEELAQRIDTPERTMGLAPALLPAPATATPPSTLLSYVQRMRGAQELETGESLLRQRARMIHTMGRGTLLEFSTGERTRVDACDPEEFWSRLSSGGRWTDEGQRDQPTGRLAVLAALERTRLRLDTEAAQAGKEDCLVMLSGTRGALSAGSVALVLGKIFQESGLRASSGTVCMNARTAQRHSLSTGCGVRVATQSGSLLATLHVDEAVADDVALLPVGPSPHIAQEIERPVEEDVFRICSLNDDGTWKRTIGWIERT